MRREGKPGRIVAPGDRPGRRRGMKARMSFPEREAVFVKLHDGEPFKGVLVDIPLKEGGSVPILFPPDQAKALAVQLYKCALTITGEMPDAGSIFTAG